MDFKPGVVFALLYCVDVVMEFVPDYLSSRVSSLSDCIEFL